MSVPFVLRHGIFWGKGDVLAISSIHTVIPAGEGVLDIRSIGSNVPPEQPTTTPQARGHGSIDLWHGRRSVYPPSYRQELDRKGSEVKCDIPLSQYRA